MEELRLPGVGCKRVYLLSHLGGTKGLNAAFAGYMATQYKQPSGG